jgi:hypothetical protein
MRVDLIPSLKWMGAKCAKLPGAIGRRKMFALGNYLGNYL